MSDIKFYERVAQLLNEGRTFVIAHLIDRRGSTPNDPGSRMIVFPDGTSEFTIGGGPFEASVIKDAVQFLNKGESGLKDYGLVYQELGMRCGGRARVYFEVLKAFIPLFIFGAGHIGQALARLTYETGFFHIHVIDDRPGMLHSVMDRPEIEKIPTDRNYRQNIPDFPEGSYVVIVTRCHDVDEVLLRRYAGNSRLDYLGMIGSRSKVQALFKQLEKEGWNPHHLAAIDAPIGVETGGKSPVEVAVSILARLIQVKNGKYPRYRNQIAQKAPTMKA